MFGIGRQAGIRVAMAAAMINAAGLAPAAAQEALAWIELKPLPGGHLVQITAHAMAFSDLPGAAFTLKIERKSAGNASSTKQGGRADLKAGEPVTLSSTALNVEGGAGVNAELELSSAGGSICKAMVSSRPARTEPM